MVLKYSWHHKNENFGFWGKNKANKAAKNCLIKIIFYESAQNSLKICFL